MKSVHKEEYRSMLKWLINKRLSADLSQQQLADKLDKPQSYVSKFENGERRLDLLEVLSICSVVNANAHDLIDTLSS